MTEFQNKKQKLSLNRFKKSTDTNQDEVLRRRKAENTNKSTKLWVDCFEQYIKERQLPLIDTLTAEQLPKMLESFYVDVRSQKVICDSEGNPKLNDEGEMEYEEYTNNSMRSLRAALNCFFKLKLNININPAFIRANELFDGKMRINKQEAKGTTKHKSPITDQDLSKLSDYFKRNMAGPPNATLLQEIVLFNIIFYMGRRVRENLRSMTKDTYSIATTPEGIRYIYQEKDEADKNHTENDTDISNQARIYEVQGEKQYQFSK